METQPNDNVSTFRFDTIVNAANKQKKTRIKTTTSGFLFNSKNNIERRNRKKSQNFNQWTV